MRQPKPKTKPTSLNRDSVVYFSLSYQVENVREDKDDLESASHDLAKELWEDPNKSTDLERQALSELQNLLGVKIWVEAGGDNDIDCKISAISSWYDVERLWDKIQRRTTGGDDIITLETPYMEAGYFRLYPRGVNGPRFGPNEADGDIDQWLTEHTPSPKVEDSSTAVAGGTLLATWPDGTGLWRVTGSVPGKPFRSLVQLELWREGAQICRLLLWDFGPDHDRSPREYEFSISNLTNPRFQLDYCARRLCWFFTRNAPSTAIDAFVLDALVDDLGLPRTLPQPFSSLTEDHPVEEEARRVHAGVSMGKILASLDLFNEVKKLVGGEDAFENDERLSFLFDTTNGNRYWLVHGRLSGPGRGWRFQDEEYDPNWAVKTPWVKEEGPASWYVVNENETVVGAGRTPYGAIYDTPSLVLPGQRAEWEERRLEPGRLVHDPEIHLLLGEWPPAFWPDERFIEFAKFGRA